MTEKSNKILILAINNFSVVFVANYFFYKRNIENNFLCTLQEFIQKKEKEKEREIYWEEGLHFYTADMKSVDEPEKLGQRYINQEFRYSEHRYLAVNSEKTSKIRSFIL